MEMETGLNSVIEAGQVRSVHARSKGEVLRMALSFYGGHWGMIGVWRSWLVRNPKKDRTDNSCSEIVASDFSILLAVIYYIHDYR